MRINRFWLLLCARWGGGVAYAVAVVGLFAVAHRQLVREPARVRHVIPVLIGLWSVGRPPVVHRLEFTAAAAPETVIGFDAALGAPFILTGSLRMFNGLDPTGATV